MTHLVEVILMNNVDSQFSKSWPSKEDLEKSKM